MIVGAIVGHRARNWPRAAICWRGNSRSSPRRSWSRSARSHCTHSGRSRHMACVFMGRWARRCRGRAVSSSRSIIPDRAPDCIALWRHSAMISRPWDAWCGRHPWEPSRRAKRFDLQVRERRSMR
jgi:hypothetical protein